MDSGLNTSLCVVVSLQNRTCFVGVTFRPWVCIEKKNTGQRREGRCVWEGVGWEGGCVHQSYN